MYVCNKGIGGGGGLQKIFSALWTSVWSKNKGCGEPSPGSATPKCHLLEKTRNSGWKIKRFTPFRSGRCRKYGM